MEDRLLDINWARYAKNRVAVPFYNRNYTAMHLQALRLVRPMRLIRPKHGQNNKQNNHMVVVAAVVDVVGVEEGVDLPTKSPNPSPNKGKKKKWRRSRGRARRTQSQRRTRRWKVKKGKTVAKTTTCGILWMTDGWFGHPSSQAASAWFGSAASAEFSLEPSVCLWSKMRCKQEHVILVTRFFFQIVLTFWYEKKSTKKFKKNEKLY